MCVHESLELVLLLNLITSGQSLLFLLLVKHHLLDGGASFAIQVRELRILGLNLLCINLGVALDHTVPPVHTVNLDESELQGAFGSIGL